MLLIMCMPNQLSLPVENYRREKIVGMLQKEKTMGKLPTGKTIGITDGLDRWSVTTDDFL